MRDYSVASVSFGSLIGLTRGEGLPQIWGLKLCQSLDKQALAAIWSCNTGSGYQAPVLVAETLVLQAIAEEEGEKVKI